MKAHLEKLLTEAVAALDETVLAADARPASVAVTHTSDSSHGDFASNLAMTLARAARRRPRELAELIVAALPPTPLIERTEIAGPGFINFHLAATAFHDELATILDDGEAYGCSSSGGGRRVLVEFVSANPTGPLHVGHGRHAAYGATVANLLAAAGHDVQREYYVNDAGRQMDILGVSTWLRYLQATGERLDFPRAGYHGGYVVDMGERLRGELGERLRVSASEAFAGVPADGSGEEPQDKRHREAHVDGLIARAKALLGEDFRGVVDFALGHVLADIRDDLGEFGIEVDEWFSERKLVEGGRVSHALEELRRHGDLEDREGAVWFLASRYGDEKDRVVVRENGQTTYIASDIAYHLDKRERGHDLLIDVLGADHHGYVPRVRAGLVATGQPADCLEVQLVQFVTLYRGEERAQMSTRSGQYVTLRELRSEVGNDAARFFYVMRSHDQHLNFDLELAKSRRDENPVFYIQYAHARICSIFRQLAARELAWDRGGADLARLDERERELMKLLARYPEVVSLSASQRAPHHVVHYLRSLANALHTYYNACRVIVDGDPDPPLRNARLTLLAAVRQVLHNGLGLLGVSAPESM